MQILHFSDLHGKLPNIPKKYRNADTVIFLTGDICDNNVNNFEPMIKSGNTLMPSSWNGPWNFRKINFDAEAKWQNGQLDKYLIPCIVTNDISLDNVIIFRGNHDWCDFESRFTNSLNHGTKTIYFHGIKIGIMTGVLPLDGEWFDEIEELEFANRIKSLDKDIEILLTHSPPLGILDSFWPLKIGSSEIQKAIFGKCMHDIPYFTNLRLHCFGHAHKFPNVGIEKHEILIDTKSRVIKFSNAAEQKIEMEFCIDKPYKL